jgi:hypothetical protein
MKQTYRIESIILYTMLNITEDNKIHLQRFKNEPPHASYN